jgi:hypothetical protein
MKRKLLIAVGVSAFVALLLPFASMTIAYDSFSDTLTHPGFWLFYAKAFLWYFICAVIASLGTMYLTD